MSELKSYRRKLPHIQIDNAVYFVTFNLVGAMPKNVLIKLKDQTNQKLKQKNDSVEEKDFSNSTGMSKNWLKEKVIANIVEDSMLFLDNKDYNLICYCVMSNHVHVIIYNLRKPLNEIMHSIKSFTANKCNLVLNRKGRFWQREYFDRIIRNTIDLEQKISYVLNNPVKAGIVEKWSDFEYVYCHPEFLVD